MMKTIAICFLLLVVAAHHGVDAREHSDRRRRNDDDNKNYKLFVFGGSMVDNGNLERTPLNKSSRSWYYPYGSFDSAHGNRATGRFSDGLVQSDYVAKILGHEESPRPYSVQGPNHADPFGVNFAVSGSGRPGETELPLLDGQVDMLSRLVRRGIIDQGDLEDASVALIAITGVEYADINETSSFSDVLATSSDVTDKIVDAVKRLQELGVSKVLVDMLPPLGCSPYRSSTTNYSKCDSFGNTLASIHNNNLVEKMRVGNALLLDLYHTFKDVAQNSVSVHGKTANSTRLSSSGHFRHKYAPCCAAFDIRDDGDDTSAGYCGQVDDKGRELYSVCPTPGNYFYWDFAHPTQAGWKAVMDLMEDPIKEFLGISSSDD